MAHSPCRKRGEAKGDRQKNDQKRQKKWQNGYQKVTETEKSDLPPFAYPLLRHAESQSLRGNRIRGNRTQSLWEKICLWEGVWEGLWEGGFSEIFQRFWEVFRGFERFSEFFERFSEIFERFSEVLSETLSEALSPVAPNRVAPWTFSNRTRKKCRSQKIQGQKYRALVAPCCAIPRDYLSDTPPYCALWGFWCPQHGQLGCDTPSPFSERFPLGVHAK